MVSGTLSAPREPTIEDSVPVPEPDGFFEVISYRFGVHADSPRMQRYVARVMRRFSLDRAAVSIGDHELDTYHLFDAGPGSQSRYRVVLNGTWVRGTGDYGDCLNQFFWHVNEEAYKRSDRYLLIHAGVAVGPNGRAVLIPADSGAGKTTLVTGLVRAGFGYLTDETAVIDPETMLVHPFPKALTIKASGREVWPDLTPGREDFHNGYWHLDPDAVRSGCLASPTPPGLVVFPRYVPGAPTELRRVTPGRACSLLGRNCFNLYLWRARALPVLAGVATTASAWDLVSGSLDEAVDAIRSQMEA